MSDRASKNAGKTTPGRPFKPGNPGGPGRPSGSRNKATLALDKLAGGDAEAILRKQLDKAKEGDARAAELILTRVWPVRKGRPVTLALPPVATAADIVTALGCVTNEMAAGNITPDEAAAIASVLETKRRSIETTDLARRIEVLEAEKTK